MIVTMVKMVRERKRKRKRNVVTEVPDFQGEKDTDKEEEDVRLLKDIQVDVKRLWEGLLFYSANKQLSEYYFNQGGTNFLAHVKDEFTLSIRDRKSWGGGWWWS